MKKTMLVALLAAFTGSAVTVLIHPVPVHAQRSWIVNIHQISPGQGVQIFDSSVVGFACNETQCYIATR